MFRREMGRRPHEHSVFRAADRLSEALDLSRSRLGDAGRRTLNQSLVMEESDDEYRGRVMSFFMLNRGLMPLGVLPTSILMDILGARVAIGVLAFLLLGFTITVLATQKRVREMQ